LGWRILENYRYRKNSMLDLTVPVRPNPIFHTNKRRLKKTIIGYSIEIKDPMTPERDGLNRIV